MLVKQAFSQFTKSFTRKSSEFFSLFNRKQPTNKKLNSYDIVIIGCHYGGILSRHLEKVVTKGRFKMMVVLDKPINQIHAIRQMYEQQRCSKTDYLLPAKLSLDKNTAHSDDVGCKQILPEKNKIILNNGREIRYDHLVIAMGSFQLYHNIIIGMRDNVESIKGFESAWQDLNHPVFSNHDHPSWRSVQHKYARWHYNFYGGNAFFCIPQYPFRGEVESYNFFLSQQIWKWQLAHGRLSPLHSFTIMNANDKFVQNNKKGDQFFKRYIQKTGINVLDECKLSLQVEYGQKLVEINKEKQQAIFEDIESGERYVRRYSHLYQMMPFKPHKLLIKAGLTTQKGLLDVNKITLRHNKFRNIFGLGDVCDLPTTKGAWASFHQIAVVRTNLLRSFSGQTLIAKYDGYTKIPILLGQNKLTYLCHKYDDNNAWHSLINKSILTQFRYYNWVKNYRKLFLDVYLGKNYGPPYYKLIKKYRFIGDSHSKFQPHLEEE